MVLLDGVFVVGAAAESLVGAPFLVATVENLAVGFPVTTLERPGPGMI